MFLLGQDDLYNGSFAQKCKHRENNYINQYQLTWLAPYCVSGNHLGKEQGSPLPPDD